jgi:hypothetical protein
MNSLIFATDATGSKGQPLYVRDDVNLTRSPKGTLIKYIRAFVHPAQIMPEDWETENHIGKCVGLNIIHNVKPTGTWPNIDSVFPLPKNANRISIPADYVRKGQSDTSFPGNDATPASLEPVQEEHPLDQARRQGLSVIFKKSAVGRPLKKEEVRIGNFTTADCAEDEICLEPIPPRKPSTTGQEDRKSL